MPRFKGLIDWFRDLASQPDAWFARQPLPPVLFPDVRRVDRPPRNEDIGKNAFYLVSFRRRPKWALFQCPCGCKTIVTLSLQKAHRPYWTVKNRVNRPTLQPSVWRDVGCLSHFWIHDGRVYWCPDSGTFPRNERTHAKLFSD